MVTPVINNIGAFDAGWSMQLNKGDIIKDGEKYFSVFCIMCSVIYVKRVFNVNSSPYYELEEVLKHYRKIEIMNN